MAFILVANLRSLVYELSVTHKHYYFKCGDILSEGRTTQIDH
jgi:hypothetical protein